MLRNCCFGTTCVCEFQQKLQSAMEISQELSQILHSGQDNSTTVWRGDEKVMLRGYVTLIHFNWFPISVNLVHTNVWICEAEHYGYHFSPCFSGYWGREKREPEFLDYHRPPLPKQLYSYAWTVQDQQLWNSWQIPVVSTYVFVIYLPRHVANRVMLWLCATIILLSGFNNQDLFIFNDGLFWVSVIKTFCLENGLVTDRPWWIVCGYLWFLISDVLFHMLGSKELCLREGFPQLCTWKHGPSQGFQRGNLGYPWQSALSILSKYTSASTAMAMEFPLLTDSFCNQIVARVLDSPLHCQEINENTSDSSIDLLGMFDSHWSRIVEAVGPLTRSKNIEVPRVNTVDGKLTPFF